MSDKQENEVVIRSDGKNTLTMTLPEGVTAVIRRKVPLEDLLKVLRVPDPKKPSDDETIELMAVTVHMAPEP